MCVAHGSLQGVMTPKSLYVANISARFQEVRRVTVPEKMNTTLFVNAGLCFGLLEDKLSAPAAIRLVAVPFKEVLLWFVPPEVLAKRFQQLFRKRHHAVLFSFALPNMQHHAFGVYIPDFQAH